MRKLLKNAPSKCMAQAAWLFACVLAISVTGCGSGLRSAAGASAPATVLVVSAAPKLGYAWNSNDKTLRPIIGIPGAAQFGESVTSAGIYGQGEADPTGSIAVLLGDDQSVYTMSLPGGSPVLVAGKAPIASTIVFSPKGTWAFIFSRGSAAGKLLTQLSGTALSKNVTFSGPLKDAMVSDAGTVAAALNAPDDIAVQATASSGAVLPLAAVKGYGGMSFIAGTEDLLLADASTDSLLRFRSASTSPSSSPVPTAGLLKKPVSLATSRTSRWAVIANSGDASVIRVDLSGGTPAQRTVCNCKPSTVNQLSDEGSFRLTALQDGPVLIGDASKSAFPILFIPALQGQTKGTMR